MAVKRYNGAEQWRENFAAPGQHIMVVANYSAGVGDSYVGGLYVNEPDGMPTQTPAKFPLRDIAFIPTKIGFRTIAGFGAAMGTSTWSLSDSWGYPSSLMARQWTHNSATDAVFEFYGIPAGCLVDVIFLGYASINSSGRGGVIRINERAAHAEVVTTKTSAQAEAVLSGPVRFPGIEPVGGVVRISMQMNTIAIYVTMLGLRVYRR